MNLFLILYYFFIGAVTRRFFEVGQIFHGIAFIACGISLHYLVAKLKYAIQMYKLLKDLKSTVELLQIIKLEIFEARIYGESNEIDRKSFLLEEHARGVLDSCEKIKKHEKNKWIIDEIDEIIRVIQEIRS